LYIAFAEVEPIRKASGVTEYFAGQDVVALPEGGRQTNVAK